MAELMVSLTVDLMAEKMVGSMGISMAL